MPEGAVSGSTGVLVSEAWIIQGEWEGDCTYTFSRKMVSPRCWDHRSPERPCYLMTMRADPRHVLPTIISWSLSLTPMRDTFCRYLSPARISCWTLNCAFMRNVAPSLMVKGLSLSASRAPLDRRSMMMSGRPSTSRPSERMMHLRGSLGSEMSLPWPRPRDAFHFWSDSSSWSAGWGQRWGSWWSVCTWLPTQFLVLVNRLLFADLEALGLLGLEIVVVGHAC